jgi:ATP-dependent DNA helicase RecG
VDRVIALMRERSLPAPQFSETASGFRVRLFNEQEPEPRLSGAQPGTYYGFPLNTRQEIAIRHLTEGDHYRITNSDLQELFPDVHPETLRRDLADLVNKGILAKFGQKRGSYYVLQRPPKA